jgi:hypothetical protein
MSDQFPSPPDEQAGGGLPPPPDEAPVPPRGAGDIIGSAFEIYGKNARQLLIIVAIIAIPLSVLSWLITQVILEGRSGALAVIAVLAGIVIGVVTGAILQAALLRAAAQATLGDSIDVDMSYRWGLRRFGGVILVSLLVALAFIVGAIPGVLIAVGVPALGVILAFVGAIALMVLFSASIPALIVENLRATEALRRSWNLVKPHFWHAFTVIIVSFLIAAVVGGLIGSIGGTNDVVRLIFGAIAQIIVAPFSALVSVLLYIDLRTREEPLTPSGLRRQLGAQL